MAEYNNFKVDTDNALGFQYDEFKNNLMQLSLTDSKAFFSLKNAITSNIKKTMIKRMYQTFYNLMSIGATTDAAGVAGNPGSAAEGAAGVPGDFFIPNLPSKRVSDFAMKAGRTLEALLLECINEIMPKDYYDLASERARKKSDLQAL